MKPCTNLTGSAGTIHIHRKSAARTARIDLIPISSLNSTRTPMIDRMRMFLRGAAYKGVIGMADAWGIAGAAISGGVLTQLFQAGSGWLKQRHDSKHDDRKVDAQLEEHRDNLTLKLLDAAQRSVAELQKQVGELLPHMTAAAHLQEALDHLYALLHADGSSEIRAAQRRASAFLRRMRPEVGDLRNAAQINDSARHMRDRMEGSEV